MVLLAVLAGGSFAAANAPSLEGLWKGTVELPGQALEIVVRIAAAGGGAWSGTIDIPAQGARNLTLSKFEVLPDAVRFSIAGVPGDPTFRGTLSPSGIVGQLTQGGQTFAFRLERSITGDERAVNETPKGELETPERRNGTKPAHPLDEYVGDYANPAQGTVSVSREGADGLRASIRDKPVRLEHWRYETFRAIFDAPASAGEKILILFRTNFEGDVDALEMRLEPERTAIVFEKKGRS